MYESIEQAGDTTQDLALSINDARVYVATRGEVVEGSDLSVGDTYIDRNQFGIKKKTTSEPSDDDRVLRVSNTIELTEEKVVGKVIGIVKDFSSTVETTRAALKVDGNIINELFVSSERKITFNTANIFSRFVKEIVTQQEAGQDGIYPIAQSPNREVFNRYYYVTIGQIKGDESMVYSTYPKCRISVTNTSSNIDDFMGYEMTVTPLIDEFTSTEGKIGFIE